MRPQRTLLKDWSRNSPERSPYGNRFSVNCYTLTDGLHDTLESNASIMHTLSIERSPFTQFFLLPHSLVVFSIVAFSLKSSQWSLAKLSIHFTLLETHQFVGLQAIRMKRCVNRGTMARSTAAEVLVNAMPFINDWSNVY